MVLKKTNIEEKLEKLKAKSNDSEHILDTVYRILKEDSKERDRIAKTLNGGRSAITNQFDFDLLESHRIYHIDQIKTICIDYRLRFLDSKYFKSKIPQEAYSKIKELEKAHNTELKGFKIVAPSKLFKLDDKDDPLLFAPIGNNYFYLIHKWGNDLHPLRKALVWPFKNIVNLGLLVVLISYLCTLLVPDGLFSKSGSSTEFWIIFFFMFKSIASVVIFYGFALGKNFNPAIWNSKYFNA
ncbi:hypothetical protein FK220_007925 [Flavobacteriaceae bacterium TP-CH-4]|uniref:Uncharacterized protein n=1 Tax=Pelagihabitans pacificus TaxID=2696054 RepID=A0A967ARX8_9FLAO|nr:hypothetical protein [Pelagihabitans pacificus]NHF59264.1 hypothetical protein [Pelagihabitans pacificus]